MINGRRKKKWNKHKWTPLSIELLRKPLSNWWTHLNNKEETMKVHTINLLINNPWRITAVISMEMTGRFRMEGSNHLLHFKRKDINCLQEPDLRFNLFLRGFHLFKIQVWWTQIFMVRRLQTEDPWEISITTILQDKQLLKINLLSQAQMRQCNNLSSSTSKELLQTPGAQE